MVSAIAGEEEVTKEDYGSLNRIRRAAAHGNRDNFSGKGDTFMTLSANGISRSILKNERVRVSPHRELEQRAVESLTTDTH